MEKNVTQRFIYLFVCGLFDDVSTIIGSRVKNDLEGIYKEAVVAWFGIACYPNIGPEGSR